MITKIKCKHCRKEFETYEPKKRTFCSMKCKSESMKTGVNKNKHICQHCGKIFYDYYDSKFCSQKCYGVSKKGCVPWNKGIKGYSTLLKGQKRSQEFIEKQKISQKGKKMPESYCKKLSKRMKGSGNPAFNNWATREPYGKEWSPELREEIRARDSHRCQECFRHQTELKERLSVHHIDFNKKNNSENNLISLCRTCHLQTNWGKKDWVSYYQQRRMESV